MLLSQKSCIKTLLRKCLDHLELSKASNHTSLSDRKTGKAMSRLYARENEFPPKMTAKYLLKHTKTRVPECLDCTAEREILRLHSSTLRVLE